MKETLDDSDFFEGSNLTIARPAISDDLSVELPQPAISGDLTLKPPAISDDLSQVLLHYLMPIDRQ